MRNVEAVIFDWAGTTVDYGGSVLVWALVEGFKQFASELMWLEVRDPR